MTVRSLTYDILFVDIQLQPLPIVCLFYHLPKLLDCIGPVQRVTAFIYKQTKRLNTSERKLFASEEISASHISLV